MTYEEFADAIEGIHAYDTGCTDSGIHDEVLRAEVANVLQGPDVIAWLSRFVREAYLSEKAAKQGYNIEDVASFIRWLGDRMEFDL